MKKTLVILGPTSTGKTDLALRLASLVQGELVSVDSRQVYKGLDIGAGKLPSSKFKVQSAKLKKQKGFWEIDGIKVWMYDVADPKKQYTVFDYVKDANKVVEEILNRGKLPIIVGGTGFYLKALLEGLPNLEIPVDQDLRKKLLRLSLEELQKKLQEIAPKKWERMNDSDRQNPRRLVRAIEVAILNPSSVILIPHRLVQEKNINPELYPSGRYLDPQDDKGRSQNDSRVLKIGLTAPCDILYQRIDERVVGRINQGMVDEAKGLYKKGLSIERMRQLGLEYGVLADYLEGKIKSKEELVKVLQGKIHNFCKRQITWFKKENPSTSSGRIQWFDISERNYIEKVENLISKWYDNSTHVTQD